MAAVIRFEVEGTPAAQGSKSAVLIGGKARLIEGKGTAGREKHRSWRVAVAQAARDVASRDDVDAPFDGPLAVELLLRFRMPQSRPAWLRKIGIGWHTTKPDSDKVARACLDALVDGGLLRDDARVCELVVRKVELWASWTGAEITIRPAGQVTKAAVA